jgi:hypothetical protein
MKEEPSSLKCKDKFLVQSTMIAPELEHLSVNELWSAVTDDASKIHQQKLKVVYLPAEGILHEEDEPDASGMGHSSLLSHEGDASVSLYFHPHWARVGRRADWRNCNRGTKQRATTTIPQSRMPMAPLTILESRYSTTTTAWHTHEPMVPHGRTHQIMPSLRLRNT